MFNVVPALAAGPVGGGVATSGGGSSGGGGFPAAAAVRILVIKMVAAQTLPSLRSAALPA